jgi:hypothetical protein
VAGTPTFKITKWYGDQIVQKVQRASQAGIDDVLAESVADAEANHWWQSRSGTLEANTMREPAERVGRVVRGSFGVSARQAFYGLFLERRMPFLRPAADRTFPRLASAIRNRLR